MIDYLQIMKGAPQRGRRVPRRNKVLDAPEGRGESGGGKDFFTQRATEGTVAGYPPKPYEYGGAPSPPSY